jgi:hypothetical protein
MPPPRLAIKKDPQNADWLLVRGRTIEGVGRGTNPGSCSSGHRRSVAGAGRGDPMVIRDGDEEYELGDFITLAASSAAQFRRRSDGKFATLTSQGSAVLTTTRRSS